MAYILHIESATRVCSVALSEQGRLVALKETNSASYSHASLLTGFIDTAIQEAGIQMKDLSAVAVSKGPGSYTGLRIGVSVAKGLCYGLDIPLISVSTLEAMAYHCRQVLATRNVISPEALEAIYCPMIDARRMEIYFGLFDHNIQEKQAVEAAVVGTDSFSELLDTHKLMFFGDGAPKCKPLLTRVNAVFIDNVLPSAIGMIQPAMRKYANGDFEDVAYFEPWYLKNFVAGIPRVRGLHADK